MTHRPPTDSEQRRVDAWNRDHLVGERVVYRAALADPSGIETKTTSGAFMLSGHTACVMVKYVRGCVKLSNITAIREVVKA